MDGFYSASVWPRSNRPEMQYKALVVRPDGTWKRISRKRINARCWELVAKAFMQFRDELCLAMSNGAIKEGEISTWEPEAWRAQREFVQFMRESGIEITDE